MNASSPCRSQDSTAQVAPVPDTYPPASPQKSMLNEFIVDPAEAENPGEVGLGPEVLKILGADPSKPKNTGIILQEELEARWGYWLSTHLSKEDMDKLLNQYPRESKKCLFEAPKLNPEIAAMSTPALIERDQKFVAAQNTVGSALIALGSAISSLLNDEEIDKLELLRRLWDSGKLMTQSHRGFLLEELLCLPA